MEESSLHVNNLPAGLLHAIFKVLGPKDLCAVSATCKHWRELNQDAPADKVAPSTSLPESPFEKTSLLAVCEEGLFLKRQCRRLSQ